MVAKAVQNASQMQAKCKPNASQMQAKCRHNVGILPPLFLSLSCHFVNIFPTTMQSSCHPSPNLFLSLSCLCPNFFQTFSTKQSKTTKQPLLSFAPHQPRYPLLLWRELGGRLEQGFFMTVSLSSAEP